MTLPDCFDCKYGGLEHPCRTADGRFNFEKAARAYIGRGRRIAIEYASGAPSDEAADDWIGDCEYDLVEDCPELILPLAIAAMDECETPMDASWLAAGLIENGLVKHGPQLIGPLEQLASRSAKVRYILSGVWSQSGSVNKDVWARLGRAIGSGGSMSDDPREASDGSPPVVVDEQAAIALLKERVADAARSLGLGG